MEPISHNITVVTTTTKLDDHHHYQHARSRSLSCSKIDETLREKKRQFLIKQNISGSNYH